MSELHPRIQYIVDTYGKLPETLDEVAEATIAVINKEDRVVGFAWQIEYASVCSNSHAAPHNGETNWGYDKPNAPRGYPGFRGRFWIRYAKDPASFKWSGNFRKTLTHTGTGGAGAYDGPWSTISHMAYIAKRKQIPQSDDLFALPIPTTHCYSTDYTIFLADHPGLDIAPAILAHEEQEDKNVVWNKTAGKRYERKPFVLRHKFEWNDPEFVEADAKFIKDFEFYDQEEPA